MELMLYRGRHSWEIADATWRGIIALAAVQGWRPSSGLTGEESPQFWIGPLQSLHNLYFDDHDAIGLGEAFRDVLLNPLNFRERIPEDELVSDLMFDPSWGHMYRSFANRICRGKFAAIREVVLDPGLGTDRSCFRLDARSWEMLQRLAHLANGWLPPLELSEPDWLSKGLRAIWVDKGGTATTTAWTEMGLDSDTCVEVDAKVALGLAEAVSTGLKDCPDADQLSDVIGPEGIVPDYRAAIPTTWFSGPRRAQLSRFIRFVQKHGSFEVR